MSLLRPGGCSCLSGLEPLVSTTMVLLLVLSFSLGISRLLDRWTARRPIPVDAAWAVTGILVGPWVVGLVQAPTLKAVQPVISLALGLLGFTIGLSLRRGGGGGGAGREAGIMGGSFTIAIVALPVGAALWWLLPDLPLVERLGLPLALGAGAAVTDGRMVDRMADYAGAVGPVRELLRAWATAAAVVAVAVFGLGLAAARSGDGSATLGLTPVEWLVASTAAGAVCGLLFTIFLGRDGDDQRAFLATVAVVTFASGLAAGLGVSPLLVGLVAGLTMSLLSPEVEPVRAVLQRIEVPTGVVVLVFAGATWTAPDGVGWVLAAVTVALRPVALGVAGYLAPRLAGDLPRAHRLGRALTPQGALAVAIALNYAQVFPRHAGTVLTAALGALLLADGISSRGLRAVLSDAGEVRRRATPEPLPPPAGPAAAEGASPCAS